MSITVSKKETVSVSIADTEIILDMEQAKQLWSQLDTILWTPEDMDSDPRDLFNLSVDELNAAYEPPTTNHGECVEDCCDMVYNSSSPMKKSYQRKNKGLSDLLVNYSV